MALAGSGPATWLNRREIGIKVCLLRRKMYVCWIAASGTATFSQAPLALQPDR
jgi:hypothetical protein